MTNYLIRRVFQMVLVILLSTMAIYVLLNVAPGGPLSGLRLGADIKSRVTEDDIARLEAFLGLDKPLFLRYLTWLIGDDWLGADWLYVGLGSYKRPIIGNNGEQMFRQDSETGEKIYAFDTARFWVDPGATLINPGYRLWVWGEEVEPGVIEATQVQMKPAATTRPPEDILIEGVSTEVVGMNIRLRDFNENIYTIITTRETAWIFSSNEGAPRPEEGTWLNIAWLTAADGLLSKYAAFHAENAGILRMDFGTSWRLSPHQSVSDLIKTRLGNTILLMSTATVLSLVVAIPIGIYSGVHQYSKVDYAATTFAFFGSAMPVFWFGLMLILIFSYGFKNMGLPYMPAGGTQLVRTATEGSLLEIMNTTPGSLIDRVVHIILPSAMLSLAYMAGWSRYMRSSMLEVLRQDYVRTARAKGLIERVVIIKHALRNALIPIITIVVFTIPGVFGGATLTETIFSYPGIGRLYFQALGASDWPVVMAILFITAILVVFATLLGDVLYTLVDPRIRFK